MGRKMEPIRSIDQVHDIEVTLSRMDTERGRRMFLLWETGIELGLRIGDLVTLRVGDLRGQKTYTFTPQKTKHTKKNPQPVTITLSPKLKKVIEARTVGMMDQAWLFISRKKTPGGNPKHISRQTALNDIKEIGRICKVGIPIGCHTMRKTFGYQYYKKQRDVAKLQKWFDHSTPEITLIYIGIAEDELREMTDNSPFADLTDVVL